MMLVGLGLIAIGLTIILSDTNSDIHAGGVILLTTGGIILVIGITWFIVIRFYSQLRPSIVWRFRDSDWHAHVNKHQRLEKQIEDPPKIMTSSFMDAENIISETLTKEYVAEMQKQEKLSRNTFRKTRGSEHSKQDPEMISSEAMMRVSTVSHPNFQGSWQQNDTDFEY